MGWLQEHITSNFVHVEKVKLFMLSNSHSVVTKCHKLFFMLGSGKLTRTESGPSLPTGPFWPDPRGMEFPLESCVSSDAKLTVF